MELGQVLRLEPGTPHTRHSYCALLPSGFAAATTSRQMVPPPPTASSVSPCTTPTHVMPPLCVRSYTISVNRPTCWITTPCGFTAVHLADAPSGSVAATRRTTLSSSNGSDLILYVAITGLRRLYRCEEFLIT
jgi:hypothetical protein